MKLRAPARLQPGVSATKRLCLGPARVQSGSWVPTAALQAWRWPRTLRVGSLPRTARIWNVYGVQFARFPTVYEVVLVPLPGMSVQSGSQALSDVTRWRYWYPGDAGVIWIVPAERDLRVAGVSAEVLQERFVDRAVDPDHQRNVGYLC